MKLGRSRFRLPVESRYKSINGYGAVGNMRALALIGFDGSIDWLCLPKFDSPSLFAAILDWRIGGKWSLSPVGNATASQSYLKETNILTTYFTTLSSKTVLIDFMPCSPETHPWSAPPEVHRLVKCLAGKSVLNLHFEPRPNFARDRPSIAETARGISVRTGREEMVLASSLHEMPAKNHAVSRRFELKAGESETFVLSYGEAEPRQVEEYQSGLKLKQTETYWRNWVRKLRYRGRWKEMVLRSALTLKALTYAPTGAIVAAPTTSLPECLGSERNWDYRFSWIRDSAMSLWALRLVGDKAEAERYLHWLALNNPSLDLDLRLMYTIDGSSQIPEKTLDHFEGYKGSRPVRVGNAAARQTQMDTYGYMLDALYFSSKHGMKVNEEMYYRFVKPLARFISANWKNSGNSLWEIRNKKAQFVYTKAWCFAGLRRAVKIARITRHTEDVARWTTVMDKIRNEIIEKGWSERKKAFTIAYGEESLDSANLMMPIVGLLSAKDPRMIQTVAAIRRELGRGALLYRYSMDDEMEGQEGTFLLCSFWLVVCLAKMGKVGEALSIFNKLMSYSNHLGLYAEELDPLTLEPLGNFPQAFSHMGLIMAAYELNAALEKRRANNSVIRTRG